MTWRDVLNREGVKELAVTAALAGLWFAGGSVFSSILNRGNIDNLEAVASGSTAFNEPKPNPNIYDRAEAYTRLKKYGTVMLLDQDNASIKGYRERFSQALGRKSAGTMTEEDRSFLKGYNEAIQGYFNLDEAMKVAGDERGLPSTVDPDFMAWFYNNVVPEEVKNQYGME